MRDLSELNHDRMGQSNELDAAWFFGTPDNSIARLDDPILLLNQLG